MSPYERNVLDAVCDTFGAKLPRAQALIESTMGLPEWSDRQRSIEADRSADILKAGLQRPRQIESVVEDWLRIERFHDRYGGE